MQHGRVALAQRVRQPRVSAIVRADNNRPAFIHRHLKVVNYAEDDCSHLPLRELTSPWRCEMRARRFPPRRAAAKITLAKGTAALQHFKGAIVSSLHREEIFFYHLYIIIANYGELSCNTEIVFVPRRSIFRSSSMRIEMVSRLY